LVEIKQLKEKLAIEADELKSQLLKQAQDQHIEVQRKMKEDMVRERNREIEAIIEKLGDETHLTQKQLM
jgi:ClpP class serine protease